jgi:hypothetical protein
MIIVEIPLDTIPNVIATPAPPPPLIIIKGGFSGS